MSFARAARLAFQLPEKSRLKRKLSPSNEWGWQESLLNKIDHKLDILAWQNTEDARKKNPANFPKLWLPDFMPRPQEPKKNKETEAMDIDDLKAFLKRPRGSDTKKAE